MNNLNETVVDCDFIHADTQGGTSYLFEWDIGTALMNGQPVQANHVGVYVQHAPQDDYLLYLDIAVFDPSSTWVPGVIAPALSQGHVPAPVHDTPLYDMIFHMNALWMKLFAAGNMNALAALYAPGATVLANGAFPIQGQTNIASFFAAAHNAGVAQVCCQFRCVAELHAEFGCQLGFGFFFF